MMNIAARAALKAIHEPISQNPYIPYSPGERHYIPASGPWHQSDEETYQWVPEPNQNPYPSGCAAYVIGGLHTLIDAERLMGGSICWWDVPWLDDPELENPEQGKGAYIRVSGEFKRLNGTVVPLSGDRIESDSQFWQPSLRIDPESMRNPAQLAFRGIVSRFDGRFRKLADLFHVEEFDRDTRRHIHREGGFYRNSSGMVADLPVAGSEPDPSDPIAAMYAALRQTEKGREALDRPTDRILITYSDGVWTYQDCRTVTLCGTSLEEMASWAVARYQFGSVNGF